MSQRHEVQPCKTFHRATRTIRSKMAFPRVCLVRVRILRMRAISLREASRAVDVTLVGETCENDGGG
jgi:hypothetical protein